MDNGNWKGENFQVQFIYKQNAISYFETKVQDKSFTNVIVLPIFLTFFSPLSDKAVEITALEGIEMKNFTTEFPEDKIELAEDNPHNLEFNQRVFGYSPERSTDVDVPSKIKA